MKIAMLPPPWIPVPPPRYGGIELMVAILTDALVEAGHDVTLFAAPGSITSARLQVVLENAYPGKIGTSLFEIDHVTKAVECIERDGFDVLHDHTTIGVALAGRLNLPVVHTMHNGHAGARAD